MDLLSSKVHVEIEKRYKSEAVKFFITLKVPSI